MVAAAGATQADEDAAAEADEDGSSYGAAAGSDNTLSAEDLALLGPQTGERRVRVGWARLPACRPGLAALLVSRRGDCAFDQGMALASARWQRVCTHMWPHWCRVLLLQRRTRWQWQRRSWGRPSCTASASAAPAPAGAAVRPCPLRAAGAGAAAGGGPGLAGAAAGAALARRGRVAVGPPPLWWPSCQTQRLTRRGQPRRRAQRVGRRLVPGRRVSRRCSSAHRRLCSSSSGRRPRGGRRAASALLLSPPRTTTWRATADCGAGGRPA